MWWGVARDIQPPVLSFIESSPHSVKDVVPCSVAHMIRVYSLCAVHSLCSANLYNDWLRITHCVLVPLLYVITSLTSRG